MVGGLIAGGGWIRGFGVLAVALLPLGSAGIEQGKETQREPTPVTACITLGPREGTARPVRQGHSLTGGGNVDVSQPAPDTVVIRMEGHVAACGSLCCGSNAGLQCCEELQFLVEFSEPSHTGALVVTATLNGLLSGKGKHSAVGMTDADISVVCGPQEVASLGIPPRTVGGCDAVAMNTAEGPIFVPVRQGCYQLRQQLHLFATQAKALTCGRAIADFSSSSLPQEWLGACYPFQQADKSHLGLEVTLRVIPDPPLQ